MPAAPFIIIMRRFHRCKRLEAWPRPARLRYSCDAMRLIAAQVAAHFAGQVVLQLLAQMSTWSRARCDMSKTVIGRVASARNT